MSEATEGMRIKFYGTRGSLPAGLTAAEVEAKIIETAQLIYDLKPASREGIAGLVKQLAFPMRGTYGGDTTCCVVRCGETIIVLDMGSGLRRFGGEILSEMFAKKGLVLHVCMSHVHWDHIQGFPFFAPLFISREILPNNRFIFFGGVQWQGALEEVLRGQMDKPKFPVEWDRVTAEGPDMRFLSIHHGYRTQINHGKFGEPKDPVSIRASRLNHPNETYGWRIEYRGKVFVYATDTEAYAGGPDPIIVDLAKNADVLYLDCQFSEDQYLGRRGVPRLGWGHGFDKWCAEVARAANVRHLLLGHHDPAASDRDIFAMEQAIGESLRRDMACHVMAAYDGLEASLYL